MREIINKYLGNFYIEELENHEEQDRVKIYDTEMKYLDYLPFDRNWKTSGTTEEKMQQELKQENELYEKHVSKLESFETIEEMLEWLVLDYEFVGFKDETIEYLHKELNWDLPSEEYNPLDNEWINRIGNTYIVVSEY